MHITTVLGNITPDELGITLGHEHLLIDLRGWWDNPPNERAYLINQKPTLENLGELMRNPYDSRPNLLIDDPELSSGVGTICLVILYPIYVMQEFLSKNWM